MKLGGRERTIRPLDFEEIDRPSMWGDLCEHSRWLEKARSPHEIWILVKRVVKTSSVMPIQY
jgi:hypothetical protein